MKNSFILFTFLCLAVNTECYGGLRHDPLRLLLKKKESAKHYNLRSESLVSKEDSPVLVGPHAGRREDDKIRKLPGQPSVKFSQFSGYVTVDPKAGRALFYYFVEVENPLDKPLVLWLNGGLGCSSFGFGAMMELGPFRVNPDGKTLWYNQYAWNKVANVLFLESPAGVGFSHSKNLTDYLTGDDKTTADSYTFLLNWFERFPVYKTQDFFLAGESYADYYILQLADLILHNNKNTKHTIIKLKGIVLGNSLIDYQDSFEGRYNYWWTHALVSDESYSKIVRNCNFSPNANVTQLCIDSIRTTKNMIGNVNRYNIYAPLCLNGSSTATPYVVDATVVE